MLLNKTLNIMEICTPKGYIHTSYHTFKNEMQTFIIKGKRLKNWKIFHAEFKKEMHFPDYYGENMNAWIDCVDELSDKPTILQIENGKYLKENVPELFNAILECGAFVNYRKIEVGEKPNLIIATDY